jgi:uncharacterized protein (DUF58 family)
MKTIVSYVSIFILLTLFALFLDATSGLFVVIIFLSALVISSVLHIYALKVFACDFALSSELVEKGDEIRMTVRIPRAAFFLPTVFEVKFDLSYHLECEQSTYAVTLGRHEKLHEIIMTARFWGKASVGIAEISAVDILGIFPQKLRAYARLWQNKPLLTVKIFPAVPDLSQKSEFVRTLQDASVFDDNEQSREIPFAITGFPGYEHRDYVPGDPLKSVNWKLSAKRDRLLVRKPEAYAGGDQVLILDCRLSPHRDQITARTHEQTAIESMLALAAALTKQEILCRVYVLFNGEWGVTPVAGADEIERLRYALTELQLNADSRAVLPEVADENASGFVIFTARPDNALYSATDELRGNGTIPEIVSPVEGYANNWAIDETDGEIIFRRA